MHALPGFIELLPRFAPVHICLLLQTAGAENGSVIGPASAGGPASAAPASCPDVGQSLFGVPAATHWSSVAIWAVVARDSGARCMGIGALCMRTTASCATVLLGSVLEGEVRAA